MSKNKKKDDKETMTLTTPRVGHMSSKKHTNYEGSHNKKESLNAPLLRQRAHTREPRRQHVLGQCGEC